MEKSPPRLGICSRALPQAQEPDGLWVDYDPARISAVELFNAGLGGAGALDFGCGYGALTLWLREEVRRGGSYRRFLARLSVLAAQVRDRRLKGILPICHKNALSLPFEANALDAVLLSGVSEVSPVVTSAACQSTTHMLPACVNYSVLRPGGELLMHTKNRFGWVYWRGQRDHNGIPFASLLPRACATFVWKAVKNREYRIVNHSYRGYEKLFRRAGFDNVRILWPFPGYQIPNLYVDLTDAGQNADVMRLRGLVSDRKLRALGLLQTLGLLHRSVSDFSVLGQKPVNVRSRAVFRRSIRG